MPFYCPSHLLPLGKTSLMKRILILGAGLSSPTLIKYLLDKSTHYNWQILVGDHNLELAQNRINNHPNGRAFFFDILDKGQRAIAIADADIVISMLPVRFHHLVAKDCLKFKKDMVTASYLSDAIKKMAPEAEKKGLLFLNEMGVDPGIDHMSAKRIIDRIHAQGGHISVFDSSTGGLVAPGFENNPWKYKFTWNPRNVVLAGKDGGRFFHNGKYKHIPYHRLFQRTEQIEIEGLGSFEVYANRDSLEYQKHYNLNKIDTMFRGTIRRPGYCRSWDVLVQLGLTDNTFIVENSHLLSYRDFVNCFLAYNISDPVEKKVADYLGINEESEMMKKLKWLGLFETSKIPLKEATPAQILQDLCERKWRLESGDKDMVVMHHIFEYSIGNKTYKLSSSMSCIGKNQTDTAMAMTVGLPVAIATKNILTGRINKLGVQIPVDQDVYTPVLQELEEYGITFKEKLENCPPRQKSL